jgi:hypothetical protein
VQDIQRKFAHEIVASADSRLRQHAVCTASPYTVLPRQPRVVEQAGREGAGIHRDLWSEFTLTSVIGYIGVFNSKARSGAKAKGWQGVRRGANEMERATIYTAGFGAYRCRPDQVQSIAAMKLPVGTRGTQAHRE